MAAVEQLITEHLDIWSSAVKTKSTAGRGSGGKIELYGIKKLRELILELAVRGLLVPQDPNYEPASELLKKIFDEKERLIKAGRIKRQKPLSPIGEDEKPFPLPQGWSYIRFDDVCSWITSGSTPSQSEFTQNVEIPYLKVYNIRDQKIDFEYKPQFVNKSCHEGQLKRSILYPGDVVMNIVGPPLGKIAIIPNTYPEWNCNQAIVFFRPLEQKINQYLYLYLKSSIFLNYIELIGTAGQDNISVTKSRLIVLPMPPLAEQHRIVAKVDELMALCDQLEQEQTSHLSAHETLVQALLDALTQASEQEGFQAAWARIAAHFDTLFTTGWSIDQLNKTIFKLAAGGKLCPNLNGIIDSNKFQKNIILQKAFDERNSFIKAGVAKQENIKPIDINFPNLKVPDGWISCQLHEIIVCLDHKRVPVTKSDRTQGNVPYYGANGPVGLIGEKLFDEKLVLVVEDETFIGREKPFSYVITGPSWVNNHVHVLKCTSVVIPEFLNICLSYYPFIPLTSGTTGRKKLTKNTLLQIPLMIPSIEEQSRIVSYINEIDILCNSLKAHINNAQNTQLHVADAMTHNALN